MTSKEALERMRKNCCCNNELKNSEEFETIEEDLKELEKLECVMNILRWCIDFVKTVNGQYVILSKGNISEEEYDLIKKFLM